MNTTATQPSPSMQSPARAINDDSNDTNGVARSNTRPKEKMKSRRPKDNSLTQQRLKAWQPILSPPWVIMTFLFISILFIGIGVALLLTSESVEEIVVEYTDLCNPVVNPDTGAKSCVIERNNMRFKPRRDMKPPIYMYYMLENFYQNHRRYANSRSDLQLAGTVTSYAQVSSVCSPVIAHAPGEANASVPVQDIYSPCGLIAWSMFNDTFKLYEGVEGDNLICNGPNPDGKSCTKKGIAWDSDVNIKFRKPDESEDENNHRYPKEYYDEPGHKVPDVTDEDFIVWMRTAALPTFRKLYRIINTELKADTTYSIQVDYNYPVTQFGGKKYVVLTTSSWMGGKNMFMAISYLVVGSLCFVIAVLFSVGAIVQRLRSRYKRDVFTGYVGDDIK